MRTLNFIVQEIFNIIFCHLDIIKEAKNLTWDSFSSYSSVMEFIHLYSVISTLPPWWTRMFFFIHQWITITYLKKTFMFIQRIGLRKLSNFEHNGTNFERNTHGFIHIDLHNILYIAKRYSWLKFN